MFRSFRRMDARCVTSLLLAALLTLTSMIGFAVPAHAAAGPSFTNPVVPTPNSADPWIGYHNGNYYYVATTWTNQIRMRISPTIAELRFAPEQVVYTSAGNTMWAPEMSFQNNRWYLYFSVELSGGARRTHVLESAGSNAAGPFTYRGILNLMPNNGWAIDGHLINLGGALYYAFSAFHADGLQSLYMAPMSNPYTASAFGSRISAPTLAWEIQGGAVNEGPTGIVRNGRTFLTYSASHCQGPDYKIGQLEWNGSSPLAASSWIKKSTPIFQRNDAAGVYGPAHHTFFKSPDGTEDWIAYHANSSASQGCGTTRTTRVQRISWHADGQPNLGVPVSASTVIAGPSGEVAGPSLPNYRINNRNSGKVIDVQQPNTEDRARIGQWAYTGANWQKFQFVDVGGGYFNIRSLNSARCLDVLDFSTADGAQIIQYACLNGTNQQFQWVATGSYFNIRARHSNKCIGVNGASTADGAFLVQWPCVNTLDHQWTRTVV